MVALNKNLPVKEISMKIHENFVMQPDNLAINVQKQLAKINQHIDQQMDSVIWLIQVIQELFDNFQKNKKTEAII